MDTRPGGGERRVAGRRAIWLGLAGALTAISLAAWALWPEPTRARPPPQDLAVRDGWRTDFSRHTVPLDEFRGGGPPRDGIPALTSPRYVSVADSGGW